MVTYISVIPAYGVKLNNQKAVKAHYDAERDFRILLTGQYIAKHEAEKAGVKLEVRYGFGYGKVIIL